MDKPGRVKIVRLDANSKYQRLFSKDSGTCAIKSGHVILKPGEEIGEHSTNELEEVLVILKGKGELAIDKDKALKIEPSTVLYVPPFTNHNVKNNSKDILEYIFVTSNAAQRP
jgi:mannose-6-phosphate isomerase-like protein (cupin superfamily)